MNKNTPKPRKNFIDINEGFICQNCKTENFPAEKSCRNHCTNCLYSLHVDQKTPGDRESTCLGLMEPIFVEQDSRKDWIITHNCIKCEKIIRNKKASDDNYDRIIALTTNQHEQARNKKD